MKRAIVVVCFLLSGIAIASPTANRDQLVAQSREGVTRIARTLTIVNWVGQVNELLGAAPAGKPLGAAWNPKEAHWDKAFDDILSRMMKVFDDLHDAPEAIQRLSMPFHSSLTEAEAAEVLALNAAERKQLDDYADTMTLAVQLLEHRSGMKPGSPEYRESLARLTGMAKLPTITDIPKLHLSDKAMHAYQQSRSSSVDFLLTAIDGQMKLYYFDHRDALTAIAAKAARAAATAH